MARQLQRLSRCVRPNLIMHPLFSTKQLFCGFIFPRRRQIADKPDTFGTESAVLGQFYTLLKSNLRSRSIAKELFRVNLMCLSLFLDFFLFNPGIVPDQIVF